METKNQKPKISKEFIDKVKKDKQSAIDKNKLIKK
jgi:hypothetical protein